MDSIKLNTKFHKHKFKKVGYQLELNLVVVGDPGVGKTSLINTYITNTFQEKPNQVSNGQNRVRVMLNSDRYGLKICEAGRIEDLEKLINKEPMMDCFILCYAVNNEFSFDNISLKWLPILNTWFQSVPLILVATKTDTESKVETILEMQVGSLAGTSKAKQIRSFLRSSSKTMEGLEYVFVEAIHAAVKSYSAPKRSRCAIF